MGIQSGGLYLLSSDVALDYDKLNVPSSKRTSCAICLAIFLEGNVSRGLIFLHIKNNV